MTDREPHPPERGHVTFDGRNTPPTALPTPVAEAAPPEALPPAWTQPDPFEPQPFPTWVKVLGVLIGLVVLGVVGFVALVLHFLSHYQG